MTKDDITQIPERKIADIVVMEVYGHKRNILKPEAAVELVTRKYLPEQQRDFIRALCWLHYGTFAIQQDPYSIFALVSSSTVVKLRAILLVHFSLVPIS